MRRETNVNLCFFVLKDMENAIEKDGQTYEKRRHFACAKNISVHLGIDWTCRTQNDSAQPITSKLPYHLKEERTPRV